MHFKVLVTVRLTAPIPRDVHGQTYDITGYHMTLGVTATNLQKAAEFIQVAALKPRSREGLANFSGGEIEDAEFESVAISTLDFEADEILQDPSKPGVFFQSGCALFTDEPDKKWWEFWKRPRFYECS